MALAIDTVDGRGLSNEARRVLLPKKSKVTGNAVYAQFVMRVYINAFVYAQTGNAVFTQ